MKIFARCAGGDCPGLVPWAGDGGLAPCSPCGEDAGAWDRKRSLLSLGNVTLKPCEVGQDVTPFMPRQALESRACGWISQHVL
jgi:hypothetical protein